MHETGISAQGLFLLAPFCTSILKPHLKQSGILCRTNQRDLIILIDIKDVVQSLRNNLLRYPEENIIISIHPIKLLRDDVISIDYELSRYQDIRHEDPKLAGKGSP